MTQRVCVYVFEKDRDCVSEWVKFVNDCVCERVCL